MKILGPSLLVIPSCSFLLVFLDIDCSYHLFPQPFGNSIPGWSLRFCMTILSLIELITTIGAIHLILITLIMHTRSIYANIELYKSSTWKTNLPNLVLKTTRLAAVVKNSNSDGNSSPFDGYSDKMIYIDYLPTSFQSSGKT